MQRLPCPLDFGSLLATMTWIFEGLSAVVWNVVGGAIVAGLTLAVQNIRKRLRRRSFRKVFGDVAEAEYYLIYGSFLSPSRETVYHKQRPQVPRRSSSATNLTTVHSVSATRSVSYLAFEIGSNSETSPRIISDVDADPLMDISFISIGGLTNHKTVDLLDNEENVFLDFGNESIVSKTSREAIVLADSEVDYGIILKISPFDNPRRTWICCAGFGEWGTSGAAWWISRNWRTIYRRAKCKPFACITRTRVGSDDSTRMVHLFLSAQETQNAAREVHISQ